MGQTREINIKTEMHVFSEDNRDVHFLLTLDTNQLQNWLPESSATAAQINKNYR